jgi:rhodanese-related sulfurtransferase
MEPIYISARQASLQRELLLVDIRPIEERIGELGFIPGSLSAPLTASWETDSAPQDLLAHSSGVVLACLSGQRAKLAWRDAIEKPTFILEGGTLAWGAEGLPLVSPANMRETIDGVDSITSFLQSLRSCFIAEWVESSLSAGLDEIINPIELVDGCLQAEGISAGACAVDSLRRAMDRLAWHSLRVGTARTKIAHNLSVMLNTLQRLPA